MEKWETERRAYSYVDFRTMRTWEQVENAVQRLGSSFNKFHASAAFSALRFASAPENIEFFHELVKKTLPWIDSMPSRHLLLVLYSAIRINIPCEDFLESISKRLKSQDPPFDVTTPLITNAMFSIATARKRMSVAEHIPYPSARFFASEESTFAFLVDILKSENRAEKFNDADCVRVIAAFAQYHSVASTEREFLQQVCEILARPKFIANVNQMSAVLILTSLASLELSASKLLHNLIREILKTSSLELYQTKELVIMNYCLGVLKHWDEAFIDFSIQELQKRERLSEITEQGLANFVYGLAQQPEMRQKNKRGLVPFFREAGEPHRLKNFANLGLTTLLYTAGLLSFPNGKQTSLLEPILQELLNPIRLDGIQNQGLVMAFWGIAKVNLREKKFLDALLKECIKESRLKSYTHQGLALLVYSCGLLKYKNKTALTQIIEEAVQPSRITTLK